MKNFSWAFLLFAVGFAGSIELLRLRPQKNIVQASREFPDSWSRNPAAIHKVFDYSHLAGGALKSAVESHLMTEIKALQGNDGPGIQLGHFVVKSTNGEKSFACDEFDTVELTFNAEGMLESGSSPVMVAESPCRYSQNINAIDTIWIPAKQLTADRASNMDLTVNTMPQPLRLQFKDMPPFWPTKWVLTKVRLFSKENAGKSVQLEGATIRKLAGRQLAIYFR